MRTAILLVILLTSAISAAEPSAQQLARQYTEAGLAAQRAGEYDTAIALYAKAYVQIPHPVLLFNMAQANRLAGRKQLALDLYRRYLAADPEGPHARIARELTAEIERDLAARAEEQRAQEAAHADAAQHASEEQRKAELERTAQAEREVEEARRATAARRARVEDSGRARSATATESRSATTTDSTRGSTQASIAVADGPGEHRRTRRRIAAFAAGGAGLVTVGVGLYVGSRARATWDEAHRSGACDAQHRCTPGGLAAIEDAHGQARIATGATVLGVAALATGAALYWTAREPRSSPTALRAAPLVSPTAAGLVLAGGF